METQIDAYLELVRNDENGKPVYQLVAAFAHEFLGQYQMEVEHPGSGLLEVTVVRQNGDHVETYSVPATQYFDAVTNNGTAMPEKTKYTVFGVICAKGGWKEGRLQNIASLHIKAQRIILHLDR